VRIVPWRAAESLSARNRHCEAKHDPRTCAYPVRRALERREIQQQHEQNDPRDKGWVPQRARITGPWTQQQEADRGSGMNPEAPRADRQLGAVEKERSLCDLMTDASAKEIQH
jgi:hypothetical protein